MSGSVEPAVSVDADGPEDPRAHVEPESAPARPRAVSGRLAGVPLWAKLTAALLLLASAGLLVIGVVGATVLDRYLVSRVDQQLEGYADSLQRAALQRQSGIGTPQSTGTFQLPSDYFVKQHSPDGRVVGQLGSPLGAAQDPPRWDASGDGAAERVDAEPFTVDSVSGDAESWRVVVRSLGGANGNLVVAASLDDVNQTVSRLNAINVVVGVVVLALLGVVAFVVVRTSLRPLAEVEETAGAFARGDLTRRVPDGPAGTEVGRLTTAVNGMLAQIETAMRASERSEAAAVESEDRMRRFVADASHELRTPLTSIRGFAELYRMGASTDPDEVARMMRRIEDESTRMGLLVEDLLLLARLDEARPIVADEVDLRRIALDAVSDTVALDAGREVRFESVGVVEGEPLVVVGDDARLRQVVANLTSNALAHTPPGTPVTVRVGLRHGDAFVEVADQGPGLNLEQQQRVFERFYRAESSRTRVGSMLSGSGLGLSIVAALVAAHGGRVEVDSAPGAGATFRVLLPRDVDPPAMAPGGASDAVAAVADTAAETHAAAAAEVDVEAEAAADVDVERGIEAGTETATAAAERGAQVDGHGEAEGGAASAGAAEVDAEGEVEGGAAPGTAAEVDVEGEGEAEADAAGARGAASGVAVATDDPGGGSDVAAAAVSEDAADGATPPRG